MVVRLVVMALVVALTACKPPSDGPHDYLDTALILRPRWNGSSDRIAFLQLENGRRQALLSRPDGGTEVLAGGPGEQIRFVTWCPGDQGLALGLVRAGNRNQQLYLADLEGGPLKPLAVNPDAFHELGTFSRDGTRATISSNARLPDRYDIQLQDMSSQQRRTIFQGEGRCLGVRFAGKDTLLISEDTSRTSELLHLLHLDTDKVQSLGTRQERHHYQKATFRGRDLMVLTDRGAQQRYLGRWALDTDQLEPMLDLPGEVVDYAWDQDRDEVVLQLQSEGAHHLYLHDLRAGRTRPLKDLPEGYIRHLRYLGPRTIGMLYSRPDLPPTLMRWDLAQGSPTPVLSGQAASLPVVSPRRVHFHNRELELGAWLYQGHDTSQGGLIYLRHEPSEQAYLHFDPVVEWWASRGFAVLVPDVRGSSGRGRDFEALDDGPGRQGALEDVVAAADYLKSQGVERVALFGREYGGYLAIGALARSPQSFTSAVALDADLDLDWLIEDAYPWQRREWREELGDTAALSLLPELGPARLKCLLLYSPRHKSRYRQLPGAQECAGLRPALTQALAYLEGAR
ncbi:MAG: prolyl oligopeptidase family serine peptidase [Vulcanimicrobiota bacterium]